MRKAFFTFATLILIISSCDSNKQRNPNYMLDYEYKKYTDLILDTLTSRTDTIFLDFVFGMNKVEYNNHLKNLIKTKKVGTKKELKINLDAENYLIKGNSYNFYLSSRRYNSIIRSTFYQNKLKSIEILLYNIDSYTEDMLISVYKNKYGAFLREDPTSSGMAYYWIINNLEIKIHRFIQQHLIFITYSDLIIQRAIEETERIRNKTKQDKNKDKTINTQNDI